jgi:hypothetical protein
MSKTNLKRYSVYERGTDRPIIIYGTAVECAEALGISRDGFFKLLWRQRHSNTPKSIEIFEDDDEEDLDT